MNKGTTLLLMGLIVVSNASLLRRHIARKSAFLQTEIDVPSTLRNTIFDESNDQSILFSVDDQKVSIENVTPVAMPLEYKTSQDTLTQRPPSTSNLSNNCFNGKCDLNWNTNPIKDSVISTSKY